MKRTRENTLAVMWSKKQKDVVFQHPDGPNTRTDSRLMYGRFCYEPYGYDGKLDTKLLDELERRGYDITTLRFSICKKEGHPRWAEPTSDGVKESA